MISENERFAEALAQVDRAAARESLAAAEEELRMLLERFPIDGWEAMPLERYALGHEGYADSLCYLLEFQTSNLGSIRGGSARKFLIYWSGKLNDWWFESRYTSSGEAWSTIRAGFQEAIRLAQEGRWAEIDEVRGVYGAPATRLKLLATYFPDELLPIYSTDHLRHYLRVAGRDDVIESVAGPTSLNRALLKELRGVPELQDRTNQEIARFLYALADPRKGQERILRVMPGEGLSWWDDCREGGFICIGWEQVGNLDELPDRGAVEDAVRAAYPDLAPSRVGRLTNVLHEFRSLAVGDLVIANDGGHRILAVGTVVEPGYQYIAARADSPHTVAVTWDLTKTWELDPPQAWRETTGRVRASFLQRLTGWVRPGVDPPVFAELSRSLDRKRQVILFGPPGTGKTYLARRFAVRHLEARNGLAATDLEDGDALRGAEERLARPVATRTVWWVVASPKEGWQWSQLAADGTVNYRIGRLRRNYFDLNVGDLVVGYESTPTKRVVALARISSVAPDLSGDVGFTLEHVAAVGDGPSYDELLTMPDLATSEPMRFRCQGTLFALTDSEAAALAARLVDGDPSLRSALASVVGDAGVGYLTRTTFHPAYGYEDFVEGYRPVQSGAASGLVVELRDGVFSKVCQAALDDPEHTYLLLIDEINRANIPRVFGELITLLEADKRSLTVTLPSGRRFQVPPNVEVIGTMNTADRSIRLLDVALRRRFAFVELLPDPDVLADAQVGGLLLADLLDALNERLLNLVDREHQIGHALFMNSDKPVTDPDKFAETFRHDVLPTLQEYCFADYSRLADIVGEGLVDLERQRLRDDILADPEKLLAHLATLVDVAEEPVAEV